MAAAPLVQVRGVVDIDPDPRKKTLPMHFNAEVQVWEDGSFDVFSFFPTSGRDDAATRVLTDVYKIAFEVSLKNTRLALLGVIP